MYLNGYCWIYRGKKFGALCLKMLDFIKTCIRIGDFLIFEDSYIVFLKNIKLFTKYAWFWCIIQRETL